MKLLATKRVTSTNLAMSRRYGSDSHFIPMPRKNSSKEPSATPSPSRSTSPFRSGEASCFLGLLGMDPYPSVDSSNVTPMTRGGRATRKSAAPARARPLEKKKRDSQQ